ncbi:hypothetical protein ACHAXR_009634 [Thalassiosira sp. AJA248-18]
MLFHAFAHWLLFASTLACNASVGGTGNDNVERLYSIYFMTANIALNAVGYTVLTLIYRHSVKTIFNRNIPSIRKEENGDFVESFNQHLLMLRPLEIFFRFITAPLRVLPDIIVIGETRCGTTNLCGHIVSLSSLSSLSDKRVKIKCYTPFCAWYHPELDNKESFYFVGHYLGIVDPYFYRMAFPLKVTRWWEEEVKGNFFFCFDGCAQYLSSPSASYLIASAYQGKLPPPVLVACVRNPVDQAISWWKYENNAISWGEDIGLKEWNTDLRSTQYPPKTILEALEFSRSDFVSKSYSNAEKLVKDLILNCGSGNDPKPTTSFLSKLFRRDIKCLPSWSITWPGGQLSTIGRSGQYSRNIKRFNDVFQTAFGGKHVDTTSTTGKPSEPNYNETGSADQPKTSKNSTKPQIGLVHIVPLECQSNGKILKLSIRPFLSDVVRRCVRRRHLSYTTLMDNMDNAINMLCTEDNFEATRRNSGTALTNLAMDPSHGEKVVLEKHFEKDQEWYNRMLKQCVSSSHHH